MSRHVTAAIMDTSFLSRDGIRLLIEEEGFDVAVAVSTYTELVEALRDRDDGLLIILSDDHPTPMLEAAIASVRKDKPRSRIVLLLRAFDDESRHRLERLGVDGFLLRSTSRHVLMRSIELIMLGEHVFSVLNAPATPARPAAEALPVSVPDPVESVVSSPAAEPLPDGSREPEIERAAEAPAAAPPALDPVTKRDTLSAREEEILLCLVEGLSNKVIARRCYITEATVKVHLKAILRKIKVLNRTQAAVWMMNRMREPAAAVSSERSGDDRMPRVDVPRFAPANGAHADAYLRSLAVGLGARNASASRLSASRP